jgi:N-acetylmuramoyl-L-alanine amidase
MPSVFLSPSTQEYNLYVTDGRSEEYYMNQIADAMEPYLKASGITYSRNNPNLTVGGSVRLSNAGNYDMHLALHSNASPPALSGRMQGTDMYYFNGSASGEAMAEIIADNMATIYLYPEMVETLANDTLYELRNTSAPTVLVEFAYHDNYEDAAWIANNIDNIARIMVLSLTQYFGIPFVLPSTIQRGMLTTDGFSVNLRTQPNYSASIITTVPNGANMIVTGRSGDWYVVDYNGQVGYIYSGYITLI